jgi:hypothetical protein
MISTLAYLLFTLVFIITIIPTINSYINSEDTLKSTPEIGGSSILEIFG